MHNLRTRWRTSHFCLGQPAPLPLNQLPIEAEVYNAILYKKQQWHIEHDQFSVNAVNINVIRKEVAQDVINLWKTKGNLPTMLEICVIRKIKKLHEKGQDMLKYNLDRRSKLLEELEANENAVIPNTSKKPKSVDFLHQLFDICSCKCVSRLTCTLGQFTRRVFSNYDLLSVFSHFILYPKLTQKISDL